MRQVSVSEAREAGEEDGKVVRGVRSRRACGSWQGLGTYSSEMGPTGDLSSRVTWSNFTLAGALWLIFGE